ncbi:MAG TPA: asparagine--tRNA ligase [Verrucomicrobiales bacterium]|nr:asparagine--tRNA ligase [Verrucomicrobiales bacterium]
MRTLIRHVLARTEPLDEVLVRGWVRTRRDSKTFSFIELNDGSCLANVQIIADANLPGYGEISRVTTGAALEVRGHLVASLGQGQKWEIQATTFRVIGTAPDDYPLQKKGHSPEFLRSIAHLRPRTNLFGCVFRVRSRMAWSIHRFFQDRGFVYVHTPIITTSDCEGAGEMFRLVTEAPEQPAASSGTTRSVQTDAEFFGRPAYLTVSGQLEGESFACGLGDIYTFGPTFRAENSHTARHAAEFWMVEPEMAFCDLEGDIALAEELVVHLVREALEHCAEDLDFFQRFVDKQLVERLRFVAERPFARVAYGEAIEILRASGRCFDYPVEHGVNLQSEHERYLCEEHFRSPVTVRDYPAAIKPFYMRRNDDRNTVAAFDLLAPRVGELIGGSQREERLEVLTETMLAHGLSPEDYGWYLDLRRYGSMPHAGFGLGFERFLMFVTGVANIRDVIPFPRTAGQAEF